MAKIGVDHVSIANDGITIEGHRLRAMTIGENIHIENHGKDTDGDSLYAVTFTVFTQNVTVGEKLNRGTLLKTTQLH